MSFSQLRKAKRENDRARGAGRGSEPDQRNCELKSPGDTRSRSGYIAGLLAYFQ